MPYSFDRKDTRRAKARQAAVACAALLAALLQACGGGGQEGASAAQQSGADEMRQALAAPPSLATVDAGANAAAARRASGLAMNLSEFSYWSTDFPTIDQFKRAGGWFTQCDEGKGSCTFTQAERNQGKSGWDTLEQAQLDRDANGWVRSLPAANDTNVKFRYVGAILFAGDKGAHPAGVYTVLYEGKGQVEFAPSHGSVVDSQPNRALIDMTNRVDSQLVIRIKATDPADYIRNIRVIPPGGVCSADKLTVVASAGDCSGKGSFITMEALSQTQAWYPKFLADLKGVRALRFMDWARVNSSTLKNWADRPMKTDAFWSGPDGVPLGVMAGLANSLQADAWVNIPAQATDEYVRGAANLLKGQLNPQAQLILEYINEPWNGGFWENFLWQLGEAEKIWGDATPGGQEYEWVMNWHAMRSAQVCDIVKAAFGADASRVKCVLNAQAATTWVAANYNLPCPKAAAILGKECAASFDAVAIAPYFGVYISDGARRQDYITANWFNQADGGLGKLFEEIRAIDGNGNRVTPPMNLAGVSDKEQAGGALAESRQWMTNYKNDIANGPYRKPVFAYEGGQHLVNLPRDCSDLSGDALKACEKKRDDFTAKWTDLFVKANRDPRMGLAYATMMNDWIGASGQVFAAFNFVSGYGYYGAWGLRESLFKTTAESPKWQVMAPYKDSIGCWWANCQQ